MDDRGVLQDKKVPFGFGAVLKHPFFNPVSFTLAKSDDVIKMINKVPGSTFPA